jgi:magnesium-transporting ATPase (P-type)
LIELPFDSDRKKMSVVVKLTKNKIENYILFTKGADNNMLNSMSLDDVSRQKIQSDLNVFAKQGLRTLVMSKKFITDKEAKHYKTQIDEISMTSDPNKDAKLLNVYNSIENDLKYVGCSAIEDKLQDVLIINISMITFSFFLYLQLGRSRDH